MPRRGLALMGTVLLLAACGGGGGGGGGGGAPGPATAQGGFTVPTSASGGSVIAQSGSGGGGGVTYTSGGTASASVTVNGVTRTWQGTPSDLGLVQVTESADGRTIVITAKGGANGAGSSGKLAHSSYGIWLESSAVPVLAGASSQVTSVRSFVVGSATPVGDMPQTGSASYRGEAVAVELRDGLSPRPLSGELDATANFATGRLAATAALADARTGAAFGTVTMTGPGGGMAISGNGFSGSAGSSLGHAGTAQGGFAGPSAAELGGTFELTGPSTVHGAFAGKVR